MPSLCRVCAGFAYDAIGRFRMDAYERIDFDSARLTLTRREDMNGKPWRALLAYKAVTGYNPDGTPKTKWKQRNKTLQGCHTQRSAKIAANKWVAELQADQAAAIERAEEMEREKAEQLARANAVMVADYVDAFIERYRGRGGEIEHSTLSDYKAMAKHIRAEFADTPLGELSPREVDAWIRKLEESYSASLTRKACILLKLAYSYAVRDGDLRENPIASVQTPAPSRADPNALTETSCQKLLAALPRFEPTPLRTAAYIALFMGLREGEIAALRWGDVDFKRNIVNVHGAIGRGKGGTYEKAPKTADSRRHVVIPHSLIEPLRERERLMHMQLSQLGAKVTTDAFNRLYVIGDIDGNYKNPSKIGREWKVIADNLGLIGTRGKVCTFHDLRHTYATVAIANNADVKSVQSALGHHSGAMTLDVYADSDENAKRRTAAIVDSALTAEAEIGAGTGIIGYEAAAVPQTGEPNAEHGTVSGANN